MLRLKNTQVDLVQRVREIRHELYGDTAGRSWLRPCACPTAPG
jgi:hypothetical protein